LKTRATVFTGRLRLLNNTFNALKLVGLIFTIVHIGGYVTN
jgi:hypothetical protein